MSFSLVYSLSWVELTPRIKGSTYTYLPPFFVFLFSLCSWTVIKRIQCSGWTGVPFELKCRSWALKKTPLHLRIFIKPTHSVFKRFCDFKTSFTVFHLVTIASRGEQFPVQMSSCLWPARSYTQRVHVLTTLANCPENYGFRRKKSRNVQFELPM